MALTCHTAGFFSNTAQFPLCNLILKEKDSQCLKTQNEYLIRQNDNLGVVSTPWLPCIGQGSFPSDKS